MLGEHGLIAKAANPLGREVNDLVAMIRFPGGECSGETCNKFCYHFDIAPTIAQACRISGKDMDGKDLLKLVKEDELTYYDHITTAWGGSVVVYDGEYWYNGYVWDTEEGSLFDVKKDPTLCNNIISEAPEKAKQLLKLCWEDAKEPIDMEFMREFKDTLGCTPVTAKLTKC
jgi:arylsulfatase A-like enzyme